MEIHMKTNFKALALMLIASQVTLSVQSTVQEAMAKIRIARPTTAQALNDIKNNIIDELKAVKKKINKQGDKASPELNNNLHELKKAKDDIKNQIKSQFKKKNSQKKEIKSLSDHLPSPKEIKNKANDTVNSVKKHLPSQDDLHKLGEDVKDKGHAVKKGSKKVWNKFVDGVKETPETIKNFFTGAGKTFSKKRTTAAHYQLNEYQSKDGKRYYVVVTMPNISEEETRIAIDETSKGNYTLHMAAQTHPATTKKEKANHLPKHRVTEPTTDQMLSSTFIDGRHRDLHYQDGTLEVTVDLPHQVKHDTYDVEFLDHALKIEFEQIES